MLKLLVEKEIKNNLLSLRFLMALTALLIIMLGSLYIRIDDYYQSQLDYQANVDGAREEQRDSWWWRFQWAGVFVERPVQPLSVLVTGVERNPDARARVFEKNRPLIRPIGSIDRNPLVALTCPVDLLFITGIVMSLLVLVLSFDAISGEQEQGTLKLLLSFPIPRSTLLFAKWLGGLISLSLPFVISCLGAAVWILLSSRIRFSADDWLAFGLMGAASLLYIAWMFSAALMVSCWFRTSAGAMCMLLFIWVLIVLVLPNVSPYLAGLFVRVESVQSIQFKSMKIAKESQTLEQNKLMELEQKYKVDRWWQGEASWYEGLDFIAVNQEKQRQAIRILVDGREAKKTEQTMLAQAIGRLSPFALYADIVSTLAWTGPDFGRNLIFQMREYEDRLAALTKVGLKEDLAFGPERIPYFHSALPPVARRFTMALFDWLLLGAGTVVFFLGAYVSFIRKDLL